MLGRPDLTDCTKEQTETYPGMAHFAGTGPKHTWCSGCTHLFEERGATYCNKYTLMMGKRGKPIAPRNKSCRHYDGVPPEKPQRRKQWTR